MKKNITVVAVTSPGTGPKCSRGKRDAIFEGRDVLQDRLAIALVELKDICNSMPVLNYPPPPKPSLHIAMDPPVHGF